MRTEFPFPAADAAMRYALAGVPILPLYEIRNGGCACGRPGCDRPGKHPRTPNGVHGASRDPDTITRWWRWWPTANVGAATGAVFDVWDIDLPPQQAEVLTARILGADVHRWPTVRTGSGGTHVFVAATGYGNRTKFRPGCDWRGRGGYVVLPPSLHASGHQYVWLTGDMSTVTTGELSAGVSGPLSATVTGAVSAGVSGPTTATPGRNDSASSPIRVPPAPPVLLAALTPQAVRATPARAWHAKVEHRYAAAAIRRECDPVAAMAPDSGRNHALNRAAFSLGQLVAGGLVDVTTVTDALTDAAAACQLPEGEAARTIASGLAAGQRHPRTRRGAA